MPHDRCDRTLYSCAASPHARLGPSLAGNSSDGGETITSVLVSTEPT